MMFLSGLMAVTFFGIALPVLFLGFLGMCFLGFDSYKDDFLAGKTFAGILCFIGVAYLTEVNWSTIFTWWTFVYMLAWVILGAIWFLFKWNKFVGFRREQADESLRSKKERNPQLSKDEEKQIINSFRPELKKNKERAIGWIMLWPFSVLAYVFGDLLHDVAEWILERLQGTATRITNRHFGEPEAG